MTKKTTSQEKINKIIEIRQAIYAHGYGKPRDELSEMLDAICLTGAPGSFPILSLSQVFQRQWHSLYKALERGRLETEWVRCYLAQQVPQEGVQYYVLNGSSWPRPRAQTLEDRQMCTIPRPPSREGRFAWAISIVCWIGHPQRSRVSNYR